MKIHVLDPHIAERIAAGEVIERPASVVKELVENSIDAGATEIQILLEDGGKGLIELTDNGSGMGPEDLTLSVRRHATSKLQSLADLERISTLGFRGEALPSIAAVSDFSLLSRTEDSGNAYEFIAGPFDAPKAPAPITFGHFLNSPHGTRVRAVGLFSQVPARLKFLKSQGAEVSHVREWVERLAISHPQIGFKLISNDRTVLNLRPSDEVSRVQAILSDSDQTYPVLSETEEGLHRDRALKIRAHWLQGYSSPQTRKLVQVVNGRALRDRMLQQAILYPFKQALMPGQFPAVALFIEIDPAELDVNVHPTKTEIRFLNNRVVFEAVQTVIEGMIGKHGAPAYAPTSSPTPWAAAESTAPFSFARPFTFQPTPASPLFDESPSAPVLGRNPLEGARFSGILFNTYIVYDLGDELALVDQHAADERIRYERLKTRVCRAEGQAAAAQSLLIPEAVRFEAESRNLLEARLPWLEALGFEAEIFSEDTVLFRAIPIEWANHSLKVRLKSLIDRAIALEMEKSPSSRGSDLPRAALIDETLFESLAREACHSAVRAGDPLEREEAKALVEQLFHCEHPWNCPHGRPTLVRIPRGRIEEWFQRKI